MKLFLILGIALISFLQQKGWTAALEVLIDGTPSFRTEFCVGENITFVCTVPGDVHVWSVPNFVSQSDGLVVRTSTTVMRGPEMNFKLSLVDFGTNLISSLSVFAFPELNGVSIICSDPSSEMIQNSTANILGLPSPPNVTATGNSDLQSFTVTITPTGTPAVCIRHYNLTIIKDGGMVLKMINIDSSGSATVGDLDLCRNTYFFMAIVVTASMDGGPSDLVEGQVDYSAITALSDLRTMNDMVQWSIPNNIPSDCFVYSVNVSGLILISNTSNVQLKLLADVGVRQCSLEELTVTPIVHVQPFNPLTNISTTGRILTSNPFITLPMVDQKETTSSMITLMFEINATICPNVQVQSSILKNRWLVSSPLLLNVSDRVARFPSLDSGTYQCNVSLMSEAQELIVSKVIDCSTKIVCGVPLAPTNGFVGKPTGNSEVQDTVNYQCSSGQSTAEILTAICTTEGTWSPNFRLLACDQISSPSPYICIVISVVSVVCSFFVGLLGGVFLGILLMAYRSSTRNKNEALPHQASQPALEIYEEVDIPRTAKPLELQLQGNVAYGHVAKPLELQDNIAYGHLR